MPLTLRTNGPGCRTDVGGGDDILDGMTTTLVTGANKGLGYRAAQRLLAAGHDVWIGARDPQFGALDMLTIQWEKAHPRWRVNAADPGFTATDLNDHRGTQNLDEGTDSMVRLANIGSDGLTGTFSDRHGTVPW